MLLLLLIFPFASIAVEAIRFGHSITDMGLIGEWFVFWTVGIRLFVVGLRQVFQPSFTAVEIFEIHEPKPQERQRIYRDDLRRFGIPGTVAIRSIGRVNAHALHAG